MTTRDEDYYRERLQATAHPIPAHMHDGLILYLVHRRRPGHFLTAILSNDLAGAANRADAENQAALFAYAYFLYNYAPRTAWGSREAVRTYLTAEVVA